MKDFLIKAILQPFLAILFCLVFGIPFVYTGFQALDIQGVKDDQGKATINFTRVHFWGLYRVREHIEGAENATLKTSLIDRIGPRHALVSGVFIQTDTEAVRLFAGSSNFGEDLKWEVVNSIKDYIDNPDEVDFRRSYRIANIFGWVGLPFLLLGVLGLVGWPSSIIRHWKNQSS